MDIWETATAEGKRKSQVSEAKILFCVLKNTHTNEPLQSWVENRGVGEMRGGSGPEDAKLVGCCSAATAGWSDNWTSTLAAGWVQLAATECNVRKNALTHTSSCTGWWIHSAATQRCSTAGVAQQLRALRDVFAIGYWRGWCPWNIFFYQTWFCLNRRFI